MNWKDIIRKRMKDIKVSGAWLGRQLGISIQAVSNSLAETRSVNGKRIVRDTTITTLVNYVEALGGKVYIEFPNDGDMRRRERYQVTNEKEEPSSDAETDAKKK